MWIERERIRTRITKTLSKLVESHGDALKIENSKPFNSACEAWLRSVSKCKNDVGMTIEKFTCVCTTKT